MKTFKQLREEINEACWKGYKRVGGKMKNGRMVPNCVPVKEEELNEKNAPTDPAKWARAKSAAKAKFSVYPSAYANGWAAKKYKSMGGGWKTQEEVERINEDLRTWFKQKWVRFDTKGNIKGQCAREPGEGKPKCLPQAKAHSLGKKGRASAAQRKRREDPNPDRHGKAINVNTKKTNEGSDWIDQNHVGRVGNNDQYKVEMIDRDGNIAGIIHKNGRHYPLENMLSDIEGYQRKNSRATFKFYINGEPVDWKKLVAKQGVAEGYDEDDEPAECWTCRGTGEGQHEGQTCSNCHGSGIEPGERDDDFDDVDVYEGWKSTLAGAALAGASMLGGGAHAQNVDTTQVQSLPAATAVAQAKIDYTKAGPITKDSMGQKLEYGIPVNNNGDFISPNQDLPDDEYMQQIKAYKAWRTDFAKRWPSAKFNADGSASSALKPLNSTPQKFEDIAEGWKGNLAGLALAAGAGAGAVGYHNATKDIEYKGYTFQHAPLHVNVPGSARLVKIDGKPLLMWKDPNPDSEGKPVFLYKNKTEGDIASLSGSRIEEDSLSEEHLLAKKLKNEFELFKRGNSKELSKKTKSKELSKKHVIKNMLEIS